MSIQAVAWALEQDLPARPKLVLVSIANHANHIDGYCWLKAETIASEASCSRRGVFNFVGDLIRNGYVRKAPRRGDDGKQRANDYWIVLDRPEVPWIKSGVHDDEPADAEGAEADSSADDAEPQDIVDGVHAVHAADEMQTAPVEPVDMHARAPGPSAPACTHKESAEPSESKPKASSAGARVTDRALRAYRPPPPQPVGADPGLPTKQVFAYEGTRAYEAWAKHESIKHGLGLRPNGSPRWHCVTRALIDGQWKSGWYFPTLFPPEAGPDPPNST